MNFKKNDVFIYPTDTVWGIGCSLYSEEGYAQIAEIKNTAKNKPLSVMFSSVHDIFSSFRFPEEVTLDWLEDFFKLETTLGLPLVSAKIKIPKWATAESDYISLRCLDSEIIKSIYNEIKTPFFTTSLNLTGEPPITTLNEARQFHIAHASSTHLIEGQNLKELSGFSSTIIFLNENLNFEIKREGRRVDEVKNHLMKLFC